tara:strand:- start:3507 stop:3731 length:225 start_codon:yes stop_codon:yes gene_type:complete
MRRETARFKARAADGKIYTVVEYTNMIRSRPISGPAEEVAGSKSLLLTDGRHVNYEDEDTFEIVVTGETLKRVD